MTCKGICTRYQTKARDPKTGQFYANGTVRCNTCSMWIKWSERYCPCCGYQVKRKALSCHQDRFQRVKDQYRNRAT